MREIPWTKRMRIPWGICGEVGFCTVLSGDCMRARARFLHLDDFLLFFFGSGIAEFSRIGPRRTDDDDDDNSSLTL